MIRRLLLAALLCFGVAGSEAHELGLSLHLGDVAAASGKATFVGPLDSLPATTAAYSLRRLLTSYAANKAINIRATGDNATTDIGFTAAGDLDTTTLSSFLTTHGGSAAVTKWYDQSGHGNDASQATAANQPTIALNASGTRAATSWAGTTQKLVSAIGSSGAQPWSIAVVAERTGGFTAFQSIFGDPTNAGALFFWNSANAIHFLAAGSSIIGSGNDSAPHSLIGIANGASSELVVDGSATTATANAGAATFSTLGNDNFSEAVNGFIFEALAWANTDLTSNAAALTSNQRTYYGF